MFFCHNILTVSCERGIEKNRSINNSSLFSLISISPSYDPTHKALFHAIYKILKHNLTYNTILEEHVGTRINTPQLSRYTLNSLEQRPYNQDKEITDNHGQ